MAQNTGNFFKKNMTFSERNHLFAGDFRANLDETKTGYGSIYKGIELEMHCLRSRILLQKACSYKCQFCTKVCASSRLISQVWLMAGQNIKKKYLMCQIPVTTLKQHAIPNSGLQNLKIYLSKGCRKASQGWIMYVCIANTAILKLRIFSGRYHFRLWVFAATGEYFYYWHWRVLPKVLQSKWCQDL